MVAQTKSRRNRSEAEQQQARERAREKLQTAMNTLEQGVSSITDSESFKRYLKMMSLFHTYSSNNIMLISMQLPDATRVASYQTWKRLGRQVRKGEHGAIILVPLVSKHKIEVESQDEGETKEAQIDRIRFGSGSVFDISQTEGDDLPQPPAVEAITSATDSGAELRERLTQWLETQGVSVEEGSLREGVHGLYLAGQKAILISERVTGSDHAATTLLHEAAHHIARTHQGRYDDGEAIAEGAAYVVAEHYGIDSSAFTFGYIAEWIEDGERFRSNLEAIRKTAGEIIDGLEAEDDPEPGPEAA